MKPARFTPYLAALCLSVLTTATQAAGPEPASVERGREVYRQWCLACHGPGQHTPGTMALYFKYQGQKQPLLVFRDDLTPELIAVFVRNGISVMPFFRKTEISDADLAALSTFITVTAQGSKPPLPPFPPPPMRP